MKPEEAIEELNHELLIRECFIEEVNSFICDCDVDDDEYDDEKERCEISLTRYKKEKEVIEMAISAIKEIEQYREIGTVEDCREAVEKRKPKAPDYEGDGYADGYMVYDTWICPNCGKRYEVDYDDYKHCPNCGQAIQWEESEDNIMMDAVKYLKEKKRMCDSYNDMCDGCGFGKVPKCNRTEEDNPEKAVEIVERWSADHPKKTRQSKLLKVFPNAEIENGIAVACPKSLDKNVECDPLSSCDECTRKYWLSEID